MNRDFLDKQYSGGFRLNTFGFEAVPSSTYETSSPRSAGERLRSRCGSAAPASPASGVASHGQRMSLFPRVWPKEKEMYQNNQ